MAKCTFSALHSSTMAMGCLSCSSIKRESLLHGILFKILFIRNEREKKASKNCQIAARIPKISLIRPFFGGTKFNATKSTRYHNYSLFMFMHSKIITMFDWMAAKVSLHTGDGLLAFNSKGYFQSKRKEKNLLIRKIFCVEIAQ